MQITITDEQTRWIVKTAAWSEGVSTAAALSDEFFLYPGQPEEEYRRCRREAAQQVAVFHRMAELADTVEAAEIGGQVDIPESVAELIRETHQATMEAVEMPERQHLYQERLEWLHPAARRLTASFGLVEVTA
jgi:hypothetical protein